MELLHSPGQGVQPGQRPPGALRPRAEEGGLRSRAWPPSAPALRPGTRQAATRQLGVRTGRAPNHAVRPATPLPLPHGGNHVQAGPLGYRVCPPTPDRCPWDFPRPAPGPPFKGPAGPTVPTSLFSLSLPGSLLLLALQDSPPQTGQGAGARQACPCR